MARITSFDHYQQQYKASIENPEKFWADLANEFTWKKKWDRVLKWNFEEPKIEWFIGGQLNITENCLDRHLPTRGNQVAFYWEPNDPTEKAVQITYRELHERVCKFANVLKKNGVEKGDRVCIYMPMVLELTIAVLACARIGAVFTVVFGGFSANALADRINDCTCKVVITSNVAIRGPKTISLKEVVDDAVKAIDFVEKVIVYERKETSTPMQKGRDIWWHDEMRQVTTDCAPEVMNAEDMLFILYTSGSTGKPKGVVHTCGGYMIFAQYTFENVFQYDHEKRDIYWCTADVGWITGHSYIIYGPLLTGATSVIFEGIPTFPDASRFWQVVDKYKVSIFYTAPTAIRALEATGLQYVTPYKLSSLRVLGSVGEPINEEAWHWYNTNIGKDKCPIVDTWWQTETGGIMISPLAGITKTKPSFATLPLPGVQPLLVDEKGKEITGNGVEGNLCIKFPWPSIIRTTYGDHKRCKETYFSTYKNLYFTGDGCRRDEDGYYRITGRVDDVMNISGHRIGTAEVESAINMHEDIVESAVVGYPHDIKGQGIYAYVISTNKDKNPDTLRQEILSEIIKSIGPIAKPDKIQVVSGLPKTRSGKIMRRILRKIAEGDVNNLGDTSTLLEPAVVEEIINGAIK
ncbi:MAG TPA: acetate--CoA ligase [Bacteroidia bacterium]|nr:acetate--CoA ligase [Bacteroidia bacterium]